MDNSVKVQLHIHGTLEKFNSRTDYEANKPNDIVPIWDDITEINAPPSLVKKWQNNEITTEQFMSELKNQMEGSECQS